MSRPGYSDALKAILEGQPAKARPIVEVLQIVAGDIKNTQAEFEAADSLIGLDVIPGGGVILEKGLGALIDNITTFDPAGGVPIDLDNRPISATDIGAAIVQWVAADAQKPIFRAQAEVNIVAGTGEAATLTAQLFRLLDIDNRAGTTFWDFAEITSPVTIDAPGAGQSTVEFIFSGGQSIVAGNPFVILGPPQEGDLEIKPTTMLLVWGRDNLGAPAALGDWLADDNAGFTPDPGGTGQEMAGFNLNYSSGQGLIEYEPELPDRGSTPGFALLGATFAQATVTFSTDPVDIGTTPEADSELVCVGIENSAGDSRVSFEIAPAGSGTWTVYTDGDIIGVDNTDVGGSDLSGVPRQQVYDMRATLIPSSNAAISPEVFRIGVQEINSRLVADQVEIETFQAAADAITCVSEVPSASIRIRRDGVKDYRSFADELFSDLPFGRIQLRLWIGHPTALNQNQWLNIDTFNIRNYDPSGDGLAVDLIGSLVGVLGAFPPASDRGAIDLYTFDTTIQGAWTELHEQLAIPNAIIGTGPPNQEAVFRVLTEIEQGIDLRDQLDFMAGGVTVSRQGAFEFRSLSDDTPPDPSLSIDLEDYEVIGWDLGADRRATQVEVRYPDPGSANDLQKVYQAPDEVVTAYGLFGGGSPTVVGGEITDWIPDEIGNEEIPDLIGNRLIEFFSAGIQQCRIRCRTPRPQIEVGDVLSLQQDRLTQADPFSGEPVRGLGRVVARVTGVHEIMGRELTLWILSSFGVTPLTLNAPAGVANAGLTAFKTWPGEAFRPARWPEDYAGELGGSGNLGLVLADWETWNGRIMCTSRFDALTPRCVLPVEVRTHSEIRKIFMSADVPTGELLVEFSRYPTDGSPRELIASHTFNNTGGRDPQTIDLGTVHVVQDEGTYLVEASSPALDAGDTFEIFGFALQMTEVDQ